MSKRRNPNFTNSGLQTLLDEKSKNKLFSKLANVSTNGTKERAQNLICSKVHTTNTDIKSTVDEI